MTKFSQKILILTAVILTATLGLAIYPAQAQVQTNFKPPLFYSSFDRSVGPDYAVGSRDVQLNGNPVLVPNDGISGSSILLPGYSSLSYLGAGNFNISQGTISFWIKPKWSADNLNEYKHTIFSLNNNYQKSDDKYFYLGRLNTKELLNIPFSFALEDKNDHDYRYKASTGALVADQWNHVVMTWKYGRGSVMNLYINAQPALIDLKNGPSLGDAPDLGSIFTFGMPSGYTSDFQLDELMIFNTSTDQLGAQQLYAYGIKLFNYNNGSFNIVFNPTPQPSPRVLGTSTTPIITNDNSVNVPASPLYTHASALYKVAGKPDIYAILNGQKHYITSPAVFNRYGYNWSDVKTVSQAELDKFPSARLLKSPNSSTVYYVFQRPQQQWLKIAIPTPTVFVSYANNYWGNVVVVDDLDINAYPDAHLVKTATAPGVYLIEGGQRRLFSSATAFASRGYNWADVVIISQAHLDSFLPGELID